MRMLVVFLAGVILAAGLGCRKEPMKVENLALKISRVRMGMSEFEAVQAAGPPSLVLSPESGVRVLRYEGKEGGVVEITLKQNVVTDIQRKD